MLEERIELVGSTEIAEDIQKTVKTVGVRGLDTERAKELGVWKRISLLLCTMHSSIMAAYRVYGNVDYMFGELRARKNEIAKEMNIFEKAYDRFIKFWTDYYSHGDAGKEMNDETESLYHRIMKWAEVPEQWQLGEELRTNEDHDTAIKIEGNNDKALYFHRCVVEEEIIGEPIESWCVTKYNPKDRKQTTVNTNLDKGTALMIAKRLSDNDEICIYTASIVAEITEKRTEVIPFKAFKENNTIGNSKKIMKR